MIAPMVTLVRCERLLQYITGSDITFTAATKTIADAHAVFDVFSVGTKFVVAGSGDAGNQKTFTVASIAADYKSITVDETVTGDAAGDAITINEKYYSDWRYVADRRIITCSVYASQACTVEVEQSNDASNVDHTTTFAMTLAISPLTYEVHVVQNYARLAILNGGTTQTTLRAILNAMAMGV